MVTRKQRVETIHPNGGGYAPGYWESPVLHYDNRKENEWCDERGYQWFCHKRIDKYFEVKEENLIIVCCSNKREQHTIVFEIDKVYPNPIDYHSFFLLKGADQLCVASGVNPWKDKCWWWVDLVSYKIINERPKRPERPKKPFIKLKEKRKDWKQPIVHYATTRLQLICGVKTTPKYYTRKWGEVTCLNCLQKKVPGLYKSIV